MTMMHEVQSIQVVKSHLFSVQQKYKNHFWFGTHDQEIPK